MPEFAQFQQEHPVLPETPVASKAKGQNAMAQAFGQVAQQAAQASINLAKEHSQAMLMHSISQTSNIQAQAQMDMLKNPENAEAIQKSAQVSLEKAGQVPMNSGNRSKFNYLLGQKQNALKLEAFKTEAKQSMLVNKATYVSSMKQLQSDYLDSLQKGDNKGADVLYDTIKNNAKNAVLGGLVTPEGYNNVFKTIDAFHGQVSGLHDLILSKKATAAQANAAAINPLKSTNNLNVVNLPADAGTQALHNHGVSIIDKAGIDKAIYEGNITDQISGQIGSSSKSDYNNYLVKISGAMDAQGFLNSNPSIDHVQAKINKFNSQGDLSGEDQAQFHVLSNYMKGLKQNYWKTMGDSVLGAKALSEWNEHKAAANLMPVTNPAQVVQRADQDLVDEGISLGGAQTLPRDMINPIPVDSVSMAQASFSHGGDPNSLIGQLQHWKDYQRPYLAKQLADPKQTSIANNIAIGLDHDQNSAYQRGLILSNQAGFDFKPLMSSVETSLKPDDLPRINDSILRNKVQESFGDIIKNVSNQPSGGDAADALVETHMNYVKLLAIRAQDYRMKDVDTYIASAKSELEKSYDIRTGANSSFNRSQLLLADKDYDILSHSSIIQAIEEVKTKNPKLSSQAVSRVADNLHLVTTVTPEKKIIVSDQNGVIHYSAPYSSQLLNHARSTIKSEKSKKKTEDYISALGFKSVLPALIEASQGL